MAAYRRGFSKAMKYHVVVNPAGASGKTGRIWKKVEPLFKESGVDYTVYFSTDKHGIETICRELEERYVLNKPKEDLSEAVSDICRVEEELVTKKDKKCSFDKTYLKAKEPMNALIIVGGDGSVNEAINGFQNFSSFLIGYIPAGSANDLAKGMALPKDPRIVAERILKGAVHRKTDVGELKYLDNGETRRFLISSGIGFDAAICEMSLRSKYKDALNKIGLGGLIYLFSAFRLINKQQAGFADLILDKEKPIHYDRLLLLACMNNRYEGGGFEFAPDANTQDGILNLCTADPVSNAYFYLAFPFARFGKHLTLKRIHALKAKVIEVKTEFPMWVHTDGEVKRRANHIRISIQAEQIELLE